MIQPSSQTAVWELAVSVNRHMEKQPKSEAISPSMHTLNELSQELSKAALKAAPTDKLWARHFTPPPTASRCMAHHSQKSQVWLFL